MPQETQFYWVKEKTNEADHYELMLRVEHLFIPLHVGAYYSRFLVESCDYFAAPLATEMLKWLPKVLLIEGVNKWITIRGTALSDVSIAGYCYVGRDFDFERDAFYGNTPNTLADLLIWCVEQGHVTFKDGGKDEG
jgi:hypothetical protein